MPTRLPPTSISPAGATVAPSKTQQFVVVNLPSGTSVNWTLSPVLGSISASGLYTAPSSIASQQTVAVTASDANTQAVLGTASLTLLASTSVTPATATVAPGGTKQFAVLNLPSGASVAWALSPAAGSITASGLYTAPKSVASQETVTVTAKDSSTQAVLGTAGLTLTASPPPPTSVSPSTVTVAPVGTKQFSVLNLPSGAKVTWTLAPAAGSITASGLYTAPNNVASQESVTVTAKNSSTQTVLGKANLILTASPPPPTSVSPSAATVAPAGSEQFSVLNLPSGSKVTWSISPAVGSITQNGQFSAPASVPTQQAVTVTAQNSSTQAVLGISNVTLQASPAPTSVSPATATLAPSAALQFSVQALGAGVSVVWSVSPAVGGISPGGLYTAPTSVVTQQTVTVTAQNSSTQALLGTASVTITPPGSTASSVVVYPTDAPFGARCDGITDDAPAIQAAIDSLGSAGGTVHLISCSHPYLLNSYHGGHNPTITYSLLIGSNVTLEGDPGAELLQGPRGIPTNGPAYIVPMVLEFSKNSNAGCFQELTCNGGFHPLRPTEANSTQVTLSDAGLTSLFQAGDYVMIYAVTSISQGGGILPGEPNIVTSVDNSTGALELQYPLARSFSSPYIALVTSHAIWNVGLKNLIVQGWKPLQMYGAFGAVIQGNTFIHDETYFHGSSPAIIELASVRQVLFQDNVVQAGSGLYPAGLQIPDQSGMNITFDGDTFYTNAGLNFGSEFAAHITVQNSHMFISGSSITNAAVVVGGVDATFSGNDVHGTNWINPTGLPTLFTDYNAGSDFYLPYNGQIAVENNTFDCATPNLHFCVLSVLPQTALTGNQISAAGTHTIGVYLGSKNGATISQNVQGNQISVVQGDGILVTAAKTDAAVIQGNTITSLGGYGCIVVANPTSGIPDTGSDIISQNTTSGCQLPLQINTSMHPGTSTAQP